MLMEGKRLRFLEVELDPYSFQSSGKSISAIPHCLETLPSDQETLVNCFACWLHGFPLIRSSSANSEEKVRQLAILSEILHKQWERNVEEQIPFRFTCDQSQSVELEWDEIHLEHQSLIHVSNSTHLAMLHLCSTLDPLVAKKAPPFKVQSMVNILDQMPKILNMEAWSEYCFWYSELLKNVLEKFLYDAVDKYALEKHFQEFQHEIFSPFLKQVRRHLLLLQLAKDRLSKENAVIQVRYHLQKLIHDHYHALTEVTHDLEMIEETHPELEKIKRTGLYLRELIGYEVNDEKASFLSWGRGQMLKQLLCSELQVISSIHCDTGLIRTHFAFAIRAATMTMKERLDWKEFRELIFNWHEKTVLLNRFAARQGEEGLNNQSVNFELRSVIAFRELVYEYLKNFCVSISAWNHPLDKIALSGNEYYHAALLNFLPTYRDGRYLIEYDYARGAPVGLTKEGLRFYESIL